MAKGICDDVRLALDEMDVSHELCDAGELVLPASSLQLGLLVEPSYCGPCRV